MSGETNPRDTQFKGFAKALVMEMLGRCGYIDFNNWDEDAIEEYSTVIARRAHDLVGHALNKLEIYNFEICEKRSDLVDTIPDMTKWPEEQ